MVRVRLVIVALALLSCASSSKSTFDPDQPVEMRASDFSKEGDLLTPDDSMRPTDDEEELGTGGSGAAGGPDAGHRDSLSPARDAGR